jgi:hypothetical protein
MPTNKKWSVKRGRTGVKTCFRCHRPIVKGDAYKRLQTEREVRKQPTLDGRPRTVLEDVTLYRHAWC